MIDVAKSADEAKLRFKEDLCLKTQVSHCDNKLLINQLINNVHAIDDI